MVTKNKNTMPLFRKVKPEANQAKPINQNNK